MEELLLQLLNVYMVGGVKQTKMHTVESFVPEPSTPKVEVAIGKVKRYVTRCSSDSSKRETLHSEIHKLIKLIWNKEELPHQ
jgi:hypothetical protein